MLSFYDLLAVLAICATMASIADSFFKNRNEKINNREED